MAEDLAITFHLELGGLEALGASAQAKASQVVRKATEDAAANYLDSLKGSKGGKEYKRGKAANQKVHRASAPGEAPATDSGDLAGSVIVDFPEALTGVIEIGSAHGELLEVGTAKMAARPALRPAVEKVQTSFLEAMRQVIEP